LCSVGLTFVLTACALPVFNNWIPLSIIPFYLLSALPLYLALMYEGDAIRPAGFLLFSHAVFLTSSLALPIVLANSPTVAQVIFTN
uniref:ABC transporter permease n=1 Tax=Schistocephalus solidus TaxID=70667 RepID=A0A183SA35_SCHSO